MKIAVLFAMVIIFISVFFILHITDSLAKKYKSCMEYKDIEHCNLSELGMGFAEGMFIIGCFVLIDVGIIYILIKYYMSKSECTSLDALT